MNDHHNIAGNHYNKYETGNPIAKWMTLQFKASLIELVQISKAKTIHELGCGEGYLTQHIYKTISPEKIRASDFSHEVVEIAKEMNAHLPIKFSAKSVYDITLDDLEELIICCEVMEHLEQPEQALAKIHSLKPSYLILSVPREPLWRLLNMARFKYWSQLGNTPGHIQHWSKTRFLSLVSKYFDIKEVRSPIPWTMCLCVPK